MSASSELQPTRSQAPRTRPPPCTEFAPEWRGPRCGEISEETWNSAGKKHSKRSPQVSGRIWAIRQGQGPPNWPRFILSSRAITPAASQCFSTRHAFLIGRRHLHRPTIRRAWSVQRPHGGIGVGSSSRKQPSSTCRHHRRCARRTRAASPPAKAHNLMPVAVLFHGGPKIYAVCCRAIYTYNAISAAMNQKAGLDSCMKLAEFSACRWDARLATEWSLSLELGSSPPVRALQFK